MPLKPLVLLTLLFIVLIPQPLISKTTSRASFVKLEIKPVTRWTKQDIIDYIYKTAPKYNVQPAHVIATIRNETGGTFNSNIQSQIRYKYISKRWLKLCPDLKIGDYERSYGLAQIHLCDHNISIEQATNPKFAIDFMIQNFAKGNQRWWMGFDTK